MGKGFGIANGDRPACPAEPNMLESPYPYRISRQPHRWLVRRIF
jgi:hypothetical protein